MLFREHPSEKAAFTSDIKTCQTHEWRGTKGSINKSIK